MAFALPLVFCLPFVLLKSQPSRINSLLPSLPSPCVSFLICTWKALVDLLLGALGAEKKRDLGVFRQNKEWCGSKECPRRHLPWVMQILLQRCCSGRGVCARYLGMRDCSQESADGGTTEGCTMEEAWKEAPEVALETFWVREMFSQP